MEEKLIEKILQPANLTMACREVVRNKGAGGVDGMNVNELEEYLQEHRATLTEQIRSRNYHAQAIRGREIPKGGGKMRLLGIPTAIDRMLQQAVLRSSNAPLRTSIFELQLWISPSAQYTAGSK